MAGTVIRVPINNVKGGGDYTGEIRVGSQGAVANVILDTGSSTLAVIPRVYKIAEDKNVSLTSFAQLVTYGTGGWSGPVLQTTLSMGSGANQASVNTYIAIADEQLPHNLGPADGILGLAFNSLNGAYDLTAYLTSQNVNPPVTYPWLFPVRTSAAALQQVEQFLARLTEIDLTPYFTALETANVTRNIFAFYTLRSTPNMASANPATDPLNNGIFVLGGGLDQADLYTGEPLNVAVLDDLYYNTNPKGRAGWQYGPGRGESASRVAGEEPGFKLDRGQWHQFAGTGAGRLQRCDLRPWEPERKLRHLGERGHLERSRPPI